MAQNDRLFEAISFLQKGNRQSSRQPTEYEHPLFDELCGSDINFYDIFLNHGTVPKTPQTQGGAIALAIVYALSNIYRKTIPAVFDDLIDAIGPPLKDTQLFHALNIVKKYGVAFRTSLEDSYQTSTQNLNDICETLGSSVRLSSNKNPPISDLSKLNSNYATSTYVAQPKFSEDPPRNINDFVIKGFHKQYIISVPRKPAVAPKKKSTLLPATLFLATSAATVYLLKSRI